MNINFNSIKNAFMNFLVPLVALVGTVLLFVLVIYPSLGNLPLLTDELEAKKAVDEKLGNKLMTLNQLRDFKSSVDENAGLVERALVSEPAVPELLTQIDSLATNSGLEVTKLSYSFGDSGTGTEESASPFETVNVTLGAQGNFEQLKAFMSALENSARLVEVSNFRYSYFEQDEFTGLDITVVLSAPYLYVESSAVTDDPVNLDISSTQFMTMMETIKGLNFFEPTVNEDIELVEEETPTDLEEGAQPPAGATETEGTTPQSEETSNETSPPDTGGEQTTGENQPPFSTEDGSLP